MTFERQVESGRQRRRGARMIGVRVTDQDAVDPAMSGTEDRVHVVRVVRSGIDHHDPALRPVFHEPGVGASVGHRTGIVRDDPNHAVGLRDRHAVGRYGFVEADTRPLSQTHPPRA